MNSSSFVRTSTYKRGIHIPIGGTYSRRFFQDCEEDNKVPGPGSYVNTNDAFGKDLRKRKNKRGTMGRSARVMYRPGDGASCHTQRSTSPRPGPGYYNINDSATRPAASFEDDLRQLPMSGISDEKIKLKNLSRRIRLIKDKRTRIDSLPMTEKREIMCITDKDVKLLEKQRRVLQVS